MATKIIENITLSDIEIKDLGITVQAGSTYDLSKIATENVNNSNNLLVNIANGNIVVQKDPLANPIAYYTSAEAVRAIMSIHDVLPRSKDQFKIAVHSSPKPQRIGSTFSYNTHWTGSGDDVVNHVLGGGEICMISCTTGNATVSKIIEFDSLFGNVFIYQGYIGFDNAGFGDYVNVSAWAKATPLQTMIDKDFELDGNKVRLASGGPGTGTHGFAANPTLLPNYTCSGYWNYDDENQQLLPSLDQSGCYDIYNIDIEADRFMNKLPVYGTNHVYTSLEANDYNQIPPGWFLKVEAHNQSDTNWKVWFFMEMYRERSVSENF